MDSELTAVLDSLNAETVVEFFRFKSEEERLGMSKEVMRWLNKHPFQEEITTKTTGSSGLTITSVRLCDFPVLQYIPAVFNEKPKARPKKALDIVAKIAKRSPVLRDVAAAKADRPLPKVWTRPSMSGETKHYSLLFSC